MQDTHKAKRYVLLTKKCTKPSLNVIARPTTNCCFYNKIFSVLSSFITVRNSSKPAPDSTTCDLVFCLTSSQNRHISVGTIQKQKQPALTFTDPGPENDLSCSVNDWTVIVWVISPNNITMYNPKQDPRSKLQSFYIAISKYPVDLK